jgi:hypothetical protein
VSWVIIYLECSEIQRQHRHHAPHVFVWSVVLSVSILALRGGPTSARTVPEPDWTL